MIWIPIVIGALALLRCFALERHTRRLERKLQLRADLIRHLRTGR